MINKFEDNDIQELKDVVRIGIVSSVNPTDRTARVKIEDTGIVTGDLKIVENQPTIEIEDIENKVIVKPWTPKVDDWVLCIFKPDGDGDGFIVGGI